MVCIIIVVCVLCLQDHKLAQHDEVEFTVQNVSVMVPAVVRRLSS